MSGTADLPKGWIETALDSVLTALESGSRPKGGVRGIASGVPSLGGEHINEVGTFRFDHIRFVPHDFYVQMTRGHIKPGDVLVVKDGATTGRVAMVRGDFPYDVAVVNEHVFICRPAGLDSRFLFYYLWSDEGQRNILRNFRGSAQGGIIQGFASQTPIVLAPLNEQQRIVAEIETQFTRLDAAVAALERARANLKRYRVAVLKAACEGRLVLTEADLARSQGRDYEPAEVLLARIQKERRAKWEADQRTKMEAVAKQPKDDGWKGKYAEPESLKVVDLPGLSEGWVWARAEQVCNFITKGTTPAADKLHAGVGDIPFIKVYNLTFDGKLDFSVNPTFVSTETHERELARSRVVPGDVLMNIVGPPLGKVAVVPDTFDEWNMNQAVAVFRPLFGVLGSYLAICLLAGDVLNWATRRAKATAGQFNLTLEICRDLPLPIPPATEQARIVIEAERRLTVIDETEALVTRSLRRADLMRQAILKQAFEGRLVDQDPNDEPASALLERIRLERAALSITRQPSGRASVNSTAAEMTLGEASGY